MRNTRRSFLKAAAAIVAAAAMSRGIISRFIAGRPCGSRAFTPLDHLALALIPVLFISRMALKRVIVTS